MGNKLLLADDSITIQKVVGIIFSSDDTELTIVDNGLSAVEKAKELRPDIMLVDALMPGLNGYEVCAEIRRTPQLEGTPLLLLVGAFEPFDEEKSRQCGADDYISKPFESQQLVDKVKTLIELGQSRRLSAPSAVPVAEAPVAPAVVQAAVEEEEDVFQMPAAESSLETSFGMVADFAMDEDTSPSQAVSVSPAMVDEVVEAAPEDDLWGAFVLEEEGGGEAVEFGEVVVADPMAEQSIEVVDADAFAFTDVDMSAAVESSAVAEPVAMEVEFAQTAPVDGDDMFVFEEDADAPAVRNLDQPIAFEAEADEADFSAVSQPAEPPAAPLAQEDAFSFADLDTEPEAVVAIPSHPSETSPLVAAITGAAVTAVAAGVAAAVIPGAPAVSEPQVAAAEPQPVGAVPLTEEQIIKAVSAVSREIIERIAWEVVPDLAETLIREEIRRIREGK